ncbi:MAG: hypothetical protein ACW9W4_02590 [Candidatus Nitrosopumilus sp. bin_7KS]
MVKYQIQNFKVVIILLMLAASPLSVTYVFGQSDSNEDELRAILTEKVVDGKLKVNQYALPDGLSETDLQRTLSIDGQMSWAYVNYKSYNAGIVLFDGKASKLGENLWEISIDKDILDEQVIFQVVFSGKITESDEENVIAVSLMNSVIKNPETTQNLKLLQIGESIINSIDSNQEYRKSIR